MTAHIRFIPVTEIHDPLTLSIGLSGGSGTGKTYTALRMARGIAEVITGKSGAPIGYVDTENKRALHYKAAFPEMAHCDFQAVDQTGHVVGFGPERWIEIIDAAEAAELPVLILDSFSHAWEGVGGVLDMHAIALERLVQEAEKRANGRYTVDPAKYGQLAWAEVKPKYRRLIDRIVRAKCNIIICTRAKPVMQQGFGDKAKNARKTKTRREDVPWDPASDADLMFEMTTMVILDPKAPGCPVHQIKVADQFKGLLDPRAKMGEPTGRAMAEWAKGQGDAQQQKELLDKARDEARKGRNAFTAFFNSDEGKENRALIRTILAECQELAKDADASAEDSDDPFANEKPTLSPEQEAELLSKIETENEANAT
ncbi:MAG: AAA family ATPase [Pelagimonas sp.]|uniref:AAA family ATPase n=1 Tax=Pelagimonas sp. TaxID=2073170 RepID=UPI003D6BE53A